MNPKQTTKNELRSLFQKPAAELIRSRSSWRSYDGHEVEPGTLALLQQFLEHLPAAPFGNPVRFRIFAAAEGDSQDLQGLGTYGFIKGMRAFLAGAVGRGDLDMEDYGHQMELVLLKATELGLASCWLGGSFTKSSFANRMEARENEIVPAVSPLGYQAARRTMRDSIIRAAAGSKNRIPFEAIVFRDSFDNPLLAESAGRFALPLEMVRLAPSASNKQPWRILVDLDSGRIRLYLKRTPGYDRQIALTGGADLQRVDMGIGMSHFALACAETGIIGSWQRETDPPVAPWSEGGYVATWQSL